MINRFFISDQCIHGETVFFPKHVSFQLDKVLRSVVGDNVIVCDGSGTEYLVTIDQINRAKCVGHVVNTKIVDKEPSLNVHLYQALIKPDRYEYALQKGVEIGVNSFTPFTCTRSELRDISCNRMRRWKSIIMESAEQSGRTRLPVLNDLLPFSVALRSSIGMVLIPWEEEHQVGIKDVFNMVRRDELSDVSVFIGPVGGFTADEINEAKKMGSLSVSLGSRILRSETAGVIASAILLYEVGDMNTLNNQPVNSFNP